MADVLIRAIGPILLTNAAATVLTVAANKTVTIRSIHVANGNVAAAGFTMSIGADGLGTRFYDGLVIAPHGTLDWSGSLVVQAAEIVQAFSSIANALQLTVTGVATQ